MPRIAYKFKKFKPQTLEVIETANTIITEYVAKGFVLTLRQLYYQFVARALLPNVQRSYDMLGRVVSDARLAGLIDWSRIEDRTRFLETTQTWGSPQEIIESAAHSFRLDLWADQDCHVEVWIEKDALKGVIERVCRQHRVSYFACRGYVSQSMMWRAAQRFVKLNDEGKRVVVLHLGDHDPSGLDMTRDIRDRLQMFEVRDFAVDRLALNMDQIRTFNPPPNPAKMTDARAADYVAEYGYESWELDALEPETIEELIEENILDLRDEDAWDASFKREEEQRRLLDRTRLRWTDIVRMFWKEDGYESEGTFEQGFPGA